MNISYRAVKMYGNSLKLYLNRKILWSKFWYRIMRWQSCLPIIFQYTLFNSKAVNLHLIILNRIFIKILILRRRKLKENLILSKYSMQFNQITIPKFHNYLIKVIRQSKTIKTLNIYSI